MGWSSKIVCLCLWIGLSELAVAEPLAVHGQLVSRSEINKYIEYYREPSTKKLTLSEVIEKNQFKSLEGKPANFGYEEGRVWVRLKILNPSKQDLELILTETYSSLQKLTYFELDDQGVLLHQMVSGKIIPASERPISYRAFAFPIALASGQGKQIYLLAETSGSMQIPLRLEPRSHFLKYIQDEMLGFGIYYGFIILMVIYSLFMYFSIKDTRYFFYSLYIISVFFSQFSLHGLGSQHFWSNYPHWNSISTIFLIGLTFGSLSLFSIKFLEITRAQKYEFIVVTSYFGLAVLLSCLSIWSYGNSLIRMGGLLTAAMPLVFLPIGVMAMRRKVPSANFYVFAILCYTAGAGIYGLKDSGLLPISVLTEQGVVLGSVLEISLFSLGMANIMRTVDSEKRHFEIANKQNAAVARATKMLAHDVRRPLSSMKLGIQMLKGSKSNPREHEKWLDLVAREVEESTDSVNSMIADVLVMGDSTKLKMSKISLLHFIETCLASAYRFRPKLRNCIELDLGGDHNLLIDAHKMERVVANILQNFQEIVPAPTRLWIRAKKSRMSLKESITLTIGNDGPPIPKKEQECIFEVFYTEGKSSGTGLGLAVAKTVVEAHGGSIVCRSAPEFGTEFLITLQLDPVIDKVAPNRSESLIPKGYRPLKT